MNWLPIADTEESTYGATTSKIHILMGSSKLCEPSLSSMPLMMSSYTTRPIKTRNDTAHGE